MLRRIAASLAGFALTTAFVSQLALAADAANIDLSITHVSTGSENRISIKGLTDDGRIYLPFETILQLADVNVPYRVDELGRSVSYPVGATVRYSDAIVENGLYYVNAEDALRNLGINTDAYVDADDPANPDLHLEIW